MSNISIVVFELKGSSQNLSHPSLWSDLHSTHPEEEQARSSDYSLPVSFWHLYHRMATDTTPTIQQSFIMLCCVSNLSYYITPVYNKFCSVTNFLTIVDVSSGEMLKSKTSPFSLIRDSLTDFGMHTNPCWRHHRISICAVLFPYLQQKINIKITIFTDRG